MKDFIISAFGRSNVGKKRGNNEDNFYLSGVTVDSANDITAKFSDSSKLATAVFDGMGGEAAGEKASQIAAVTFGEKLSEIINSDFSESVITSTIESANQKVCDEIRKMGKRMGCTYVSLGFSNNTIHIANVGDSRAYLLRDGKLHCISKDHTVSQSMVDSGVISYEDSQKIKEKHMLTQHIGIFPDEMVLEPYFKSFEAKENDVVLLCSDGLTDMLSDSEIQAVLQQQTNPEEATNFLVEKALENGGKDNVTVIVAKVSVKEDVVPPVIKPANNNRKFFIIGGSVGLVILAIAISIFFLSKGNFGEKSNKTSSKETTIATDTTKKEASTVNASSNENDLSSEKSSETTKKSTITEAPKTTVKSAPKSTKKPKPEPKETVEVKDKDREELATDADGGFSVGAIDKNKVEEENGGIVYF